MSYGGYDGGYGGGGGKGYDQGGGGKGYGGGKGGYGGPPSGGGGGGGGLSESDIERLLQDREDARRGRDYDSADRIRDELRAGGVNIDDKESTWRTNDGRSGTYGKGGGGGGYGGGGGGYGGGGHGGGGGPDRRRDEGGGGGGSGGGEGDWANTIYVGGLPDTINVDSIVDFFGQLGPLKKSKKRHNLGEPVVHIYTVKGTSRPKGDCTVSFLDEDTAKAAVEWYNGAEFATSGKKMSVSIATKPTGGRWASGGGKGGGGKGKGGYGRPY